MVLRLASGGFQMGTGESDFEEMTAPSSECGTLQACGPAYLLACDSSESGRPTCMPGSGRGDFPWEDVWCM